MSDDAQHEDRHHPHRLPPEAYQRLWEPVSFSVCTARRQAFLTRKGIPELLVEALDRNAANHNCALIAYCIMPDHLHAIACVVADGGDLLPSIEGFKKRTGRTLRAVGLDSPIWERSFWDRHIRGGEGLGAAVRYVLANPVRAGLCERPDDWPYACFRGYPW